MFAKLGNQTCVCPVAAALVFPQFDDSSTNPAVRMPYLKPEVKLKHTHKFNCTEKAYHNDKKPFVVSYLLPNVALS